MFFPCLVLFSTWVLIIVALDKADEEFSVAPIHLGVIQVERLGRKSRIRRDEQGRSLVSQMPEAG